MEPERDFEYVYELREYDEPLYGDLDLQGRHNGAR